MRQVLYILVCIALSTSQLFSQGDWPMDAKEPGKTAWASEETELMPPFTAHEIELSAPVFEEFTPSEFSYRDSVFFFGGLTPGTNTNAATWMHWPTLTGGPLFVIAKSVGGYGSHPAATKDYLISGAQGNDAALTCFGLDSGAIVWQRELNNTYARDPVIDGNRLYIVTGSIYCLDIDDGSTIWSYEFEDYPSFTTPAIDDMNAYVTIDDSVFAFNKMTGEPLWRVHGSTKEAIVADGQHVYATAEGRILALDPEDGSEVWTHDIEDGYNVLWSNAMAVDDGYLAYVLQYNKDSVGAIVCVDKFTGQQQWSHAFDDRSAYPPSMANGYVYVVDWWTKSLWAFDTEDGSVAFYESDKNYISRPIIADGSLFAMTRNGVIMQFQNEPSSVSDPSVPADFDLTIHPQPSAGLPNVSFTLPDSRDISLTVFNSLGQTVVSLQKERTSPGRHTYDLGAYMRHVPGVYYVQFAAGGGSTQQKFVLLR